MQRAVLAVLLLLVLAGTSPWIGYVAGLANVQGRPERPITVRLSEADLEILHVRLRKAGVFSVSRLSPFDYALGLVNDPELLSSGGMSAASVVAEDHVKRHLRLRQPIWARLSRAALTVWLTRNWQSDDVVARAFEIESARRVPSGEGR